MNKKHWNTVFLRSEIKDSLLKVLIDNSYYLVYQSLTRAQKREIGASN